MTEAARKSINEADRETWMRCFTAAITGVFASRTAETRPDPGHLIDWCGRVADAGLEEVRQRQSIS